MTRRSQNLFRRLRRDRLAMLALAFLVALVLVALLAPLLAPYDPLKVDFDAVRQPPNAQHWFGTDKQGRDILSGPESGPD